MEKKQREEVKMVESLSTSTSRGESGEMVSDGDEKNGGGGERRELRGEKIDGMRKMNFRFD